MIDFDAMVKNEDMADIILFLVNRNENGIAYPSIDRFLADIKLLKSMSHIISS